MESNTEVKKLTPAEKSEAKFLNSTFKNQLTEEALQELKDKYPSDLVVDMTDETNFKAARKSRTERNKLVESINRRRIDITNDLKAHGDDLVAQVNDIFDVVVIPFEREDARQKAVAAELKRKREVLLQEQRDIINGFDEYIATAKDEETTVNDISSIIDALGNVGVEDFDQELAHEVSSKVKSVTAELTEIMLKLIETNQLKAEADAAKAAEEKANAEKAEIEAKNLAIRAIDERINNLKMIPLDLTGKDSVTIGKKLNSLKKFVVPQEEFGERYEEAQEAQRTVIETLTGMFNQVSQLEAFQAQQQPVQEEHYNPINDIPHDNELADDASYHPQEVTQEEVLAENKKDDILSTMGVASDLLGKKEDTQLENTLTSSLREWQSKNGISNAAAAELKEILLSFNVNL